MADQKQRDARDESGGERAGGGGSDRERRAGPSSQAVPEGLEGAILEEGGNEQGSSQSGRGSGRQEGRSPGSGTRTGAGAEAAEGLHAFGEQGDQTPSRSTPASGSTGTSSSPSDVERAGSEPLRGTSEQHVSGYGGGGRGPRNSSDTREPLNYEGSGGDQGGEQRTDRDAQDDRPH